MTIKIMGKIKWKKLQKTGEICRSTETEMILPDFQKIRTFSWVSQQAEWVMGTHQWNRCADHFYSFIEYVRLLEVVFDFYGKFYLFIWDREIIRKEKGRGKGRNTFRAEQGINRGWIAGHWDLGLGWRLFLIHQEGWPPTPSCDAY